MATKIAIIGAGPGGYNAALKAAALGAQVTLFEKGAVGGVCLNCGCIPSKALLDAAHRAHNIRYMENYSSAPQQGEVFAASVDFAKIQARRAAVIEKLGRGLTSLFKTAKIEYVEGEASFASQKQIKCAGRLFDFDACIIASGTQPFYPAPFDKYKDKLLDNGNIFNLQKIPASLAIIGGGVIGCEFACIFSALGCKVTIIEMLPTILAAEEEASARVLESALKKRGVEILCSRFAKDISFDGGVKTLLLDDGSSLKAEEVLVAVGRTVDLSALNLDVLGVEWNKKGVKVNPETLRLKDNIYAVGDINGLCLLAHAAEAQGETAVKDIMGRPARYDNDLVPKAIYTWPEVASVGLTKKEALARGLDVKTQKSFLLANGRALSQDESEGFVQLISAAGSGKLLGAQMAGVYASELISVALIAIKAGFTVQELAETVFPHPTVCEAIKAAAAAPAR